MNRQINLFIILPAALLVLGLAGCSKSDDPTLTGLNGTAADNYQSIDLNLDYGGLTATDEEPAFGDPYLLELDALEAEEAYNDELLADPEVRALMEMNEAAGDTNGPYYPRFTFVRLAWGTLELPGTGSTIVDGGELMDWSGQVSVDRGIVLVTRVMQFESPLDHIVRDRPDRSSLAWISHTGEGVDGLVLQIIEPRLPITDGNGTPPMPNVLHLQTASFSKDFTMDDISGLDELIEVEPAGNGIQIAAFTQGDLIPCPRGFLAGRWCDDPEVDGLGGVFRGRWIDIFGVQRGYMMGSWGLNGEGEQVFVGKYTARTGAFLGLLAGHWDEGDQTGMGNFQGHWVDGEGQLAGYLNGRWAQPPDQSCALYQGRWTPLATRSH